VCPFLFLADLALFLFFSFLFFSLSLSSLFELNVPPAAQDYLARFLVLDPTRRISMVEAMEHPWIQESFGSPVETHLPLRTKLVSEPQPDVFSQLLEYGYTEKEGN